MKEELKLFLKIVTIAVVALNALVGSVIFWMWVSKALGIEGMC